MCCCSQSGERLVRGSRITSALQSTHPAPRMLRRTIREYSMNRLMILSVSALFTVAVFAATYGAAFAEAIGGV